MSINNSRDQGNLNKDKLQQDKQRSNIGSQQHSSVGQGQKGNMQNPVNQQQKDKGDKGGKL